MLLCTTQTNLAKAEKAARQRFSLVYQRKSIVCENLLFTNCNLKLLYNVFSKDNYLQDTGLLPSTLIFVKKCRLLSSFSLNLKIKDFCLPHKPHNSNHVSNKGLQKRHWKRWTKVNSCGPALYRPIGSTECGNDPYVNSLSHTSYPGVTPTGFLEEPD